MQSNTNMLRNSRCASEENAMRKKLFMRGSVSIDKTSATIKIGYSEQLTATVGPENASSKNVTWKTSDATRATVSASGKVAAIAEGAAKAP